MNIENWFKRALVITFLMNMVGAVTFLPPVYFLRRLGGFPEAENPFYGWLIAIWIFLFGLAYLKLAFSKSQERLFVLIGAAGKSSFAFLLVALWWTGDLPGRSAFAGLADLLIAGIFILWLYRTRIS